MKLIRPARNRWLVPGIILLTAILNLFNMGLAHWIRVIWWIILPIALALVIIGVINHRKYIQAEENGKIKEIKKG